MRWVLLLCVACGGSSVPVADANWSVYVSPDAPEAVRWAADDLVRYLDRMGESAAVVEHRGRVRCGDSSRVVLSGDGLNDAAIEGATDQTYRIVATECAGRFVELAGGGLLGRQYAVYEWLHSLGVRFFHPEEEFVPSTFAFAPLEIQHTPAYTYRSVSLHLTHPLELGDAFNFEDERYLEDGRRYIDWLIKNLASFGHGGVGSGELSDYGLRRGMPTSRGMRLYGAQQGSTAILDPDDPRPDTEQIAEAIEERVADDPPDFFSVGFDPSEFTEEPDDVVVRQLTFVADYFAERYPDVQLQTTVHGTAGEPTETYGLRYYDLPQLAPNNLGVKVHTLMFYDVFRPAPVYGNTDFTNLYDFMEQEAPNRQVWYFPESAWWLTFDIPIPLYLPITIEARDRDIQGLAHLLDRGLDGHRVFGSGHEWGYWQNEYCSFRMSNDLSYRWTDCVDDITSPMGAAAAETSAILQEVVARQAEFMFDAEALRWLVGTDPETEIAAGIGVVFHPLPPSPNEILRWTEEEVAAFEDEALPLLQGIERDFFFLANRLRALQSDVPEAARNVFDEILDGVEAFQLRAKHQWQVYGALVKVRAARLRGEPELIAEAEQQLMDAAETSDDVVEVIRRREEGYRYSPISRSIAGGPDGTEDENWTIYEYRYLNRTHHAYYFTRIDALAQEAFAGAAQTVSVEDAVLAPDEMLSLAIDAALESPMVDYGDGTTSTSAPFEHTYEPGVFSCEVTGTVSEEAFSEAIPIAAVREEHRTGFSGRVLMPEGAEIIEGVMPAMVFGPVDELAVGARIALGFSLDETTHFVGPSRWIELASASDSRIENEPADVEVPIVNRSTGSALTNITVEDAVLVHTGAIATLSGALLSEGVVQAVVAIGGFDEQGARRILASTLGYTPETLPERLDFVIELDVLE